ncbi:hypothetical protein T484DRAFT_1742180 [Baffinella frigidus]|nr:hypothetical protein T484DRAFT_1742180 [Cryptophyta sp. CCMP2293]
MSWFNRIDLNRLALVDLKLYRAVAEASPAGGAGVGGHPYTWKPLHLETPTPGNPYTWKPLHLEAFTPGNPYTCVETLHICVETPTPGNPYICVETLTPGNPYTWKSSHPGTLTPGNPHTYTYERYSGNESPPRVGRELAEQGT